MQQEHKQSLDGRKLFRVLPARFGSRRQRSQQATMKALLQAFMTGCLVISALLGDFRMAQATQVYVRDNFGTVAYTNNNGSTNWAGPWVESNDDGTAGGGDIRITGGELRFDNRSNPNTDESIARNVNLSNVNSAILSFDARTTNTEAGDTFEVAVYDGDTSTWTVLQTFNGVIADQTYYYDLTPYVSADTRIRFGITGAYGGADEYAYLARQC